MTVPYAALLAEDVPSNYMVRLPIPFPLARTVPGNRLDAMILASRQFRRADPARIAPSVSPPRYGGLHLIAADPLRRRLPGKWAVSNRVHCMLYFAGILALLAAL